MADAAEEELLARMCETGAHARCNGRRGRRNVTLRRCLVAIEGEKRRCGGSSTHGSGLTLSYGLCVCASPNDYAVPFYIF